MPDVRVNGCQRSGSAAAATAKELQWRKKRTHGWQKERIEVLNSSLQIVFSMGRLGSTIPSYVAARVISKRFRLSHAVDQSQPLSKILGNICFLCWVLSRKKVRDKPTLLAAGRTYSYWGTHPNPVPNRQDVRSGSTPSRCTLHFDQLMYSNHTSGMKLPGRLGTTMAVHGHLTMWVRE
jgi:hypothetical protein